MNKNYFSFFCLIVLLLFIISLFAPRKSGIFLKEEYRDTTIFNVTYRDTTIYNIEKRDTTIYRYTTIPLKDTIRINDTLYMSLPISWYWFKDEYADVFCTGYNVSLDSVNYHFREVTKMIEKDVIIPPKRLTANVGISLLNCDGWNILLDGSANFRINDKLSIDADVGIVATGNNLLPFAKGGLKYRLR